MFTNDFIARGLESIAELLDDAARAMAVRRAAALIRGASAPLVDGIRESGLEAVHALGIDWELSGVVTDWVRCGRLYWLEQLQARRRRALASVPGIGPRLAQELREVLGVEDVDGLAEVARDGRLQQVCGFGPKRLKLVMSALRVQRQDSPQLSLAY